MSDPINMTGPTPANGGCGAGGDGFSGVNGVNSSGVSGSESGRTDPTTTTLTGSVSGPGRAGDAICYARAVAINNATLGPGIYVFENGVSLSGTVRSGPGGTTIDVEGGSFTLSSGSTLDLVAPQSSGTASYETNGIALMQPASNTNQIAVQFGSSSGSLTGIIYAPGAQLYLHDSGGGGVSLYSDLIVSRLFDKAATVTINNYTPASAAYAPLKQVTLVE
jgi:hypothetical protein